MNETFIQSAYFASFEPPFEHIITVGELDSEQIPTTSMSPRRLTKLSKIMACIGAALLIMYATPKIVNAFMPVSTDWVMKETDAVFEDPSRIKNLSYQPAFDSSLPLGNHIQVSKIGLKTDLLEASYEKHEEALREGVWRVDNFGTPDKREKPMILAAHRFGYVAWSNQYRRENSFYNMPKLKNGDVVNVIWGQRKYVYEIYAESEGDEIIDYSADLILYTCEDLNSNIKIFRYARLLEI